jgi:teichuronic acid exporter
MAGTGSAPDLAERTFAAGRWRFASSVAQGGLQFGVGVLLARILPPTDFGLLALAYVAVGFAAMVSQLGLGLAVVQRHPLTVRHVRVAFTASLALGAGVGLVLLLLAPLAGPLLGDDRLPAILGALALLFLLGGLGATARALLQRDLEFRALFRVDLLSFGIGYAGVAVFLALNGYGVWSLVIGMLAQSLLGSLLALLRVRHSVRPLLARAELGELLGFGAGASLNQVANYLSRSLDNVVIGRWLGPHSLGLYSRAYNLMTLPLGYVGDVMWHVLFPALSEIRHDRRRMGRAYLAAVQLTALFAAPLMVGLAVAAPHLIRGVYGPQWTGAILPFQILCLAGTFRAVYGVSGALTHATDHVYAEVRRQLAYAGLVAGGALVALPYGLAGVTLAVGGAILFMYLAMAQLSMRILERPWRDFARAQLPGLIVAGCVVAAGLPVRALMVATAAGDLGVAAAVGLAELAAAVAGLYFLPPSLRPTELYGRMAGTLARLPGPLRWAFGRFLRLSPAGTHVR